MSCPPDVVIRNDERQLVLQVYATNGTWTCELGKKKPICQRPMELEEPDSTHLRVLEIHRIQTEKTAH